MLAHIKDRQHDIEGIRQDHHSHKGFEHPLKKHPCVNFMEVVAFYEHLYQLISHYKSEDDPGDWQDGSFRDLSYHGKDPGVPVRRGRAYLCGDLANALIDVIEKAVQISHDTIDEQTFQPFNDCVDDKVHTSAPFLEKGQRVTLS